jgi:putative transposase
MSTENYSQKKTDFKNQRCSCGGNVGGKKALNICEWECLFCGTFHNRDINAVVNIKVAGGQSETLNGFGGQHQNTPKVAASPEVSTGRKQPTNS